MLAAAAGIVSVIAVYSWSTPETPTNVTGCSCPIRRSRAICRRSIGNRFWRCVRRCRPPKPNGRAPAHGRSRRFSRGVESPRSRPGWGRRIRVVAAPARHDRELLRPAARSGAAGVAARDPGARARDAAGSGAAQRRTSPAAGRHDGCTPTCGRIASAARCPSASCDSRRTAGGWKCSRHRPIRCSTTGDDPHGPVLRRDGRLARVGRARLSGRSAGAAAVHAEDRRHAAPVLFMDAERDRRP